MTMQVARMFVPSAFKPSVGRRPFPRTRRNRVRSAVVVLLCLKLGMPAPAQAGPTTGGTPQDADRLFQQGLEHMKAGDFNLGCPRLAASYRLDPLPGALFTLAECEAGWKKSATALSHYQDFVSALTAMTAERRETFEERRRIAAGQIAVLSVSTPELTVEVPQNSPVNLVVKFDAAIIPPSSYGVGRRVDPGLYTATAEIDGSRIWERSITLEQGDHARVVVTVAPQAQGSAPVAADAARTGTEAIDNHTSPLRTWAYVAGGVGIAGLATGLVSGALALGQKGTIDSNCVDLKCNSQGRTALDSARGEARVSTVAFSVGLLGAAAAVILWSVAPSSTIAAKSRRAESFQSHLRVTGSGRTVQLMGEF